MSADLDRLLRSRISVVWLGLVVATLASWAVGSDGALGGNAATILVLLIAFVKIRFVGLYFMELRDAPLVLRSLLEAYCAIVCVVLVAMYLAS